MQSNFPDPGCRPFQVESAQHEAGTRVARRNRATFQRTAYLPLPTFPESISDGAIHAAIDLALAAELGVHVTNFAVALPRMSSGLGDLFLDVPGLIRAGEAKSHAECDRLGTLVRDLAADAVGLRSGTRSIRWGAEADEAALEARYFDMSLIPWDRDSPIAQNLAQAIVFGSGRPAILVPGSAHRGAFDHIAIAWDGSRVAARALGDALPLLTAGGRLSVLTISDEKDLGADDPGASLARALLSRGVSAAAVPGTLAGRPIAVALQEMALEEGARLLAMGGFGHSRLRDFFLGGATRGVLEDVRMPTLLAH